jgi:hypothetical protein
MQNYDDDDAEETRDEFKASSEVPRNPENDISLHNVLERNFAIGFVPSLGKS